MSPHDCLSYSSHYISCTLAFLVPYLETRMKSEKTVTEGMLVPCLMAGTDEWSTAEIIKIRPALSSSADTDHLGDANDEAKRLFYVHYVDFNKRLDCWVTEDRLDLANARLKGQEPVETKKEDVGSATGRCFSPTPSATNLAASGELDDVICDMVTFHGLSKYSSRL